MKELLILSAKVRCGNVTKIPAKIPELTSDFVNILMVAVPVILIIMGSIDLVKGIMSAKDDEIKKGRQIFVKRLIAGAMVFFIVVAVKLIVSVVSNNSNNNTHIVECIDCFISNKCKTN